jgi:hypothetical protein
MDKLFYYHLTHRPFAYAHQPDGWVSVEEYGQGYLPGEVQADGRTVRSFAKLGYPVPLPRAKVYSFELQYDDFVQDLIYQIWLENEKDSTKTCWHIREWWESISSDMVDELYGDLRAIALLKGRGVVLQDALSMLLEG